MSIIKTRTFRSGNSEAVRLPKEIAFGDGVELIAVRAGDILTLYRAPLQSLDDMFRALRELPAPGAIGERDEIDIPERDGV